MTEGQSVLPPAGRTRVRRILPTLAVLILVPVLAKLGFWQLDRGRQRLETQQRIVRLAGSPALEIPGVVVGPSALADSPVVTKGRYDTGYQFLLDNQVQAGQAGYHVFTPLRIQGGDAAILVNRGWIPWNTDRWLLPEISTPEGVVEVEGRGYEPSAHYFTLQRSGTGDGEWQPLRQHLDMAQIAAALPYPVQPVVILLDADSPAGGFVREWPVGDMSSVARHRAYAVQWFSLAGVVIIIWITLTWNDRRRRRTRSSAGGEGG